MKKINLKKFIPIVIFIAIYLLLILNPLSYNSFRVNQQESEIGPNNPLLKEFQTTGGNVYHFSFLVNSMDDEIYFQINRSIDDIIYTKTLNNVSLNLFDFTAEGTEGLSYYVYVNETTGQNGIIIYSYSVAYFPVNVIILISIIFGILGVSIVMLVKIMKSETNENKKIEK